MDNNNGDKETKGNATFGNWNRTFQLSRCVLFMGWKYRSENIRIFNFML